MSRGHIPGAGFQAWIELPEPWGRFEPFLVPPKEVAVLRRSLYHSEGPGYVVLPGFLADPYLSHMQRFWFDTPPPASEYERWSKLPAYPVGHPPMRMHNERRTVYSHFLWNTPPDEVSASVALAIQGLRNMVEGAVPYRGLIPDGSRVVNWRIVHSHQSEGDEVRAHEDPFPGEADELVRLQATLFLSDYGSDWSGEGFALRTNPGNEVLFGSEVPVRAGDLVLWRYANVHRVGTIETPAGGRGFLRMILPLERSLVAAPTPAERATAPGKPAAPRDWIRSGRKLLWRLNAARRRLLGGS